jgi:transposase
MAVAVVTAPATVVGGVDTRKDVDVAAALDHLGWLLGIAELPATLSGYRALLAWLVGFCQVERIGVEGTGAWGAGLGRFLRASGIVVIEVDRPKRERRRLRGKSDATDAESAGRAVLAGDVSGTPKAHDGLVESIRMLRVAQRSADPSRTHAANQLHSLLDTAPVSLREQLRILSLRDPAIAFKAALRSLARR